MHHTNAPPTSGRPSGAEEGAEESGAWDGDADRRSDAPGPPPARAQPVLSFQCRTCPGGGARGGPRITGLLWSPHNQDHLAVAFA